MLGAFLGAAHVAWTAPRMSIDPPRWLSEDRRRRHFEDHRRALGVATLAEYDASAVRTMADGRHFEFIDRQSGELRVGYYDPWAERLTVLSNDELILYSRFRCPERYVFGLRGSTYA
jgi:hypothetical protein